MSDYPACLSLGQFVYLLYLRVAGHGPIHSFRVNFGEFVPRYCHGEEGVQAAWVRSHPLSLQVLQELLLECPVLQWLLLLHTCHRF